MRDGRSEFRPQAGDQGSGLLVLPEADLAADLVSGSQANPGPSTSVSSTTSSLVERDVARTLGFEFGTNERPRRGCPRGRLDTDWGRSELRSVIGVVRSSAASADVCDYRTRLPRTDVFKSLS